MPFTLNRHPRRRWTVVFVLLSFLCFIYSWNTPSIGPGQAAIGGSADNKKWGAIYDSVSRRILFLANWQVHVSADSADYIAESISRLNVILCVIKRLVNSSQTYAIRYISGGMGYTNYDPHEQMIIFHIDSVRVTNFIHEATHGEQFEIGSIAYTKEDTLGFGDDCEDEAEAYKNQFAYDPETVVELDRSVLVHSYADITREWVKQHPAYTYVPLDSIDTNTDSGTLNNAYPWYIGKWKSRSRHPLLDRRYFIFRKVRIDTCLEAGKPRMGA